MASSRSATLPPGAISSSLVKDVGTPKVSQKVSFGPSSSVGVGGRRTTSHLGKSIVAAEDVRREQVQMWDVVVKGKRLSEKSRHFLDPAKLGEYQMYKLAYAEQLHRWDLNVERAELLRLDLGRALSHGDKDDEKDMVVTGVATPAVDLGVPVFTWDKHLGK